VTAKRATLILLSRHWQQAPHKGACLLMGKKKRIVNSLFNLINLIIATYKNKRVHWMLEP
jgi:hypothetical protein